MAAATERLTLGIGDALIVVDVQNDFLPGGSLAVLRGDEVVPLLNRYLAAFAAKKPADLRHARLAPRESLLVQSPGGPWPPHCVADSVGAQFAPGLKLPPQTTVISKADTPDKDAYSGFEDPDLDRRLHAQGVRRVFVGGLATDYCVLNTVRDARRLGYETFLLTDAVRAVNVNPDDGRNAEAEMRRLGARPCTLAQLAA